MLRTPEATYTLGDQILPFNLLTDIFDTDHYLELFGATIHKNFGRTEVTAFGGELEEQFINPYFTGIHGQQPAGVFELSRRLSEHTAAVSEFVFANRSTAIQSLQWSPSKQISLAAAGGIGADAPYGAISFQEHTPVFDLSTAYIQTADDFIRAPAGLPTLAEPVRENVLLTVRLSATATVSAGRQNFLTPVTGQAQALRSTVNDVAGSMRLAGTQLSATLFQSSYSGHSDVAAAYSASRVLAGRMQVQASYLQSRADHQATQGAFVGTVQEALSPRLAVSEQFSGLNGQNAVGVGGVFLSNVASLSASYQTYYVPTNVTSPFQNALLLDLQVHLSGRLGVHFANFLGPTGHSLYSADANAQLSRIGSGDGTRLLVSRNAIGEMVLCGRVLNQDGAPVDGAALLIDKNAIFSDSSGHFCFRENKAREHLLRVLPDGFLDGFRYHVVSSPEHVRSHSERQRGPEVTVVVERQTPPSASP